MPETPALNAYQRVIVTKRDGTCHTCGSPVTTGQGYAAVTADKAWHAFCVSCAASYGNQAAGLVKRLEAMAADLEARGIVTSGLPLPAEPMLIAVLQDTGSSHGYDVVRALQASLVALQARDVPPIISGLMEVMSDQAMTPRDRDFAVSLLSHYNRKGSLSPAQQPYAQKLVDKLAKLQGTGQAAGSSELDDLLAQVPDGYYAIPAVQGDNDLTFVRVATSKGILNPASKGKRYMRHIVGGKPESTPGVAWRIAAATAIVAAGPDEAGSLYGRTIGQCWMCHRTLTDQTSRALGIGPDCRAGR